MVNVIKIEWDDYPEKEPRRRGLTARPEFDAVRALKIGEVIKFPCTWNHSIRWGKYDLCAGKSGSQIATRKDNPERYIESVCIDKVVYVRRLKNRSWSRIEE